MRILPNNNRIRPDKSVRDFDCKDNDTVFPAAMQPILGCAAAGFYQNKNPCKMSEYHLHGNNNLLCGTETISIKSVRFPSRTGILPLYAFLFFLMLPAFVPYSDGVSVLRPEPEPSRKTPADLLDHFICKHCESRICMKSNSFGNLPYAGFFPGNGTMPTLPLVW